MIGSRRSGLERDTCGLGRWIGEVPVDRIADYRGGGSIDRARRGESHDCTAGTGTREKRDSLKWWERDSEDHFRSAKRTRTSCGTPGSSFVNSLTDTHLTQSP